ncbi:hypothetical protein SAMN05421869_12395 [Nonomuraea jiangxiensis]|uniref:Uncharacterized protein n=1 Tax=Nonomuraea jiangxiensis TaxID=633440 RepID=A0A1G9I6S8_9ACTN|nr:hypothetical protein SAMN05421869_12395 [Nonomuraea jiangxiensis]
MANASAAPTGGHGTAPIAELTAGHLVPGR